MGNENFRAAITKAAVVVLRDVGYRVSAIDDGEELVHAMNEDTHEEVTLTFDKIKNEGVIFSLQQIW